MTETPTPAVDTDAAPGAAPGAADAEPGPARAVDDAKKYRARAQVAEIRAAELTETIERYRRAEVVRLASAELANGSDVFLDGDALEDFLGESGDIDADAVTTRVAELLAARPGLHKQARIAYPELGQGRRLGPTRPAETWHSALRPS